MAFYEDFAKVYDQVMDQELYDQWFDFSVRHFGASTRKILELACGSGALSARFESADFDVTGLDISPEMLELAKKKAPSVHFLQGDMRALDFDNEFDAVTCYSDSLCYLANLAEVRETFDGVHRALKSGGIFIFDVHSTHQVDDIFPGYSYHENAEDYAFLWDSYAGEAPHSIEHDLTFFIKGGNGQFTRKDELHAERTYALTDYLAQLADFSEIEIYADFSDREPDEESKRWFFVCRK